ARRPHAVGVFHRPGGSRPAGGETLRPVRADEICVLRLGAARQTGVPGDRVARLDARGVPAGIVLARGDLELALGEADRAALVVARPSARGTLPRVTRVERAQRLPVAARRPARRQPVPPDPAPPGP